MSSLLHKKALEANLGFYENNFDQYLRNIAELDVSELQSYFMSQLPAPAHIFDVGCGSGRDSALFLSRGYRVTAIDASPAMVRIAEARGVPAKVMTFDRISYRNEFNGVWACASLLHVPKGEILSVLERLYRSLKSGGTLFATLKEGRGERIIDDGRFFAYYGTTEFSELIRGCGSWVKIESRREDTNNARAWIHFIAQKAS
jgi:SAM-dependent methyltransferase